MRSCILFVITYSIILSVNSLTFSRSLSVSAAYHLWTVIANPHAGAITAIAADGSVNPALAAIHMVQANAVQAAVPKVVALFHQMLDYTSLKLLYKVSSKILS